MVKIRLQKLGRRNRAYFRIVVTDVRVKRQGAYLEKLGQYDPIEKDELRKGTQGVKRRKGKTKGAKAHQISVNVARLKFWLEQGAQASEAVANLLKGQGINVTDPKNIKVPEPAPAAPAAPAAAAAGN